MPGVKDSTKLYFIYTTLKEVLYSLSLAYPNCQHHYFCTLRPLISKVRVTGTVFPAPSIWQPRQLPNAWRAGSKPNVHTLGKAMIHISGGMARDFIMLIRTAHHLKLMNCLPGIFHLIIFLDRGWLQITETGKRNFR